MCVACYVDEAAKDKIIAYSAKFQEMTQSPTAATTRSACCISSTAAPRH